jgi:uncharacterized protein DUF4432
MKANDLRRCVGDLRQWASVRRITLDDGVERGVRALAFSTGGGLDFWVLADRSLDIGPLWWGGMPLAWQSPAGFRSPALYDAEGDGGLGFGRSFSGFLVTGGLDHIRHPANGQPLHGRLPFTPARVAAYGEDWERDEPVLFCEGEVTQARHGGEALRLTRRIEAPIDGTRLTIHDTVENLGSRPWPQASLYHFNLGFPAIADGTVVESAGRRLLGPLRVPDAAALSESRSWPIEGTKEAACAVRTPLSDGRRLSVTFAWDATTLPHLQLWHDLQPGVAVVSVEPCTSERLDGGVSGTSPLLEPGGCRRYILRISIGSEPNKRSS